MENLYTENYTISMKEIERDTKIKDFLCSQTGKATLKYLYYAKWFIDSM